MNYGGGRQTVALLVLIKRGIAPRPDRIIIADTGRENPSTWDYRDEVAEPLAQTMGLTIEIAPRSLAGGARPAAAHAEDRLTAAPGGCILLSNSYEPFERG